MSPYHPLKIEIFQLQTCAYFYWYSFLLVSLYSIIQLFESPNVLVPLYANEDNFTWSDPQILCYNLLPNMPIRYLELNFSILLYKNIPFCLSFKLLSDSPPVLISFVGLEVNRYNFEGETQEIECNL